MDKIQIKYRTLFNMSIEQEYYSNKIGSTLSEGISPNFRCLPTAETSIFMKRKGLLFKPFPSIGGFTILGLVKGSSSNGEDLLRFPLQTSDQLVFTITARNYRALEFNNLPLPVDHSKFLYFDNTVDDPAAPRADLHLSIDPDYVGGIVDSTKYAIEQYSYLHSSLIPKGEAKIRRTSSLHTFLPSLQESEFGKSYVSFDLSIFPEGLYDFILSGSQIERFYHFKSTKRSKVIGVIHVSFAHTIANNYRILEGDGSLKTERPNYKIRLKPRETKWRYKILLQNNSPLKAEMRSLSPLERSEFITQMNVVTNDSNIEFDMTSFGEEHFIFESQVPISYQDKYYSSTSLTKESLRLSLKKYNGIPAKESVIIPSMAYPAIDGLNAKNAPDVYSDVLLTL